LKGRGGANGDGVVWGWTFVHFYLNQTNLVLEVFSVPPASSHDFLCVLSVPLC
jgi:hypothetical protein